MHYLFSLLIAFLPYNSLIRFGGNLSLPLMILILISFVVTFDFVFFKKRRICIPRVGGLFVLYLTGCIFSSIYSDAINVSFVLFKGFLYFYLYLSLYIFMSEFTIIKIKSSIICGARLGIIVFCSLLFYSLLYKNTISTVDSWLSYNDFTLVIFRNLNEILEFSQDFKSKSIMRNALSESFVLYTAIFIFFDRSTLFKLIGVVLSIYIVLILSSRRALLSVLLISVIFTRYRFNIKSIAIYAVVGVAVIIVIHELIVSGTSSRLLNFTDASRLRQYIDAISYIQNDSVYGAGYASKINGEKYIHNFIIASFYMNGLLGLLLGLMLYLYVLIRFLFSLTKIGNECVSGVFLIIPLFCLTVGSSVEGVLTLTAWVSLCLSDVFKERNLDVEFIQKN